MAVDILLKELSKWRLVRLQRAPEPVPSLAAHYRILVKRFSTDFDSCRQAGRVVTFELRFASLKSQTLTDLPHLGAACLTEDVPETQCLITGTCDNGLPVWRNSLSTKSGKRWRLVTRRTALTTNKKTHMFKALQLSYTRH